jgi:phage-related minor tail protein
MRGDAVLTLLTKVDVEGEGKLNDLGRTLSSTGTKLTAGLTVPILAAGAAVVKLAGDAAVSQAKLEATFNSMGAEAWTTVEALGAQAEKLDAMSSAFDDDAVTDFQAVLLTFGNVTGEVFDRAATAGVNMSEALGTDLQSAAIQLGKALNDPVAGLTALSRVGVSFTEQQKAQIRTMTEAGDIAGAQGIILGELERQFGGVSAAIAATPTGQFQEGMQQIQNAGESLGTILLPILSAAAGALAKVAEWFKALSPATQEWIVKIGLVVAAIGPALLIGGKLVGAFGAISKAFKAMSLLMSTNPWLLLIAAVIAAHRARLRRLPAAAGS